MASKVYIFIKIKIKLMKVKGNTISHIEFDTKEHQAAIYTCEKKQDKNKQYFWSIEESKMPENKRISPISIVLLTSPSNIYMAKGDFMTDDGKHLILPPNIFVVGNNSNNEILLRSLNIKEYFEPIDTEEAKVSDTLFKEIITNN